MILSETKKLFEHSKLVKFTQQIFSKKIAFSNFQIGELQNKSKLLLLLKLVSKATVQKTSMEINCLISFSLERPRRSYNMKYAVNTP